MNRAALSRLLRHRFPRLAVALGFYTLTGRHMCIGVVPGERSTRIPFIPDWPGRRDDDFCSDSSITLQMMNRDAAESFVTGRSYWIDITPDL